MRIIETRLKDHEGEIKLVPENLDDLWHLKYIIEVGDTVFSLTKRISESDDKLRSDKEKVTVRIGVRVEKVEFHRFANRLRIAGTIVGGIEESGHHTLNISQGKELSIIKTWKNEQLERIRYAEEVSRRPEVVIVTIEEGDAIIGALRQWGVEEVTSISSSYGKESSGRDYFFSEVLSALKKMDFKYLVVAGPGFTKEDFMDMIKRESLEMAETAIVVDASTIGTRGFIEVLKRGTLDKIMGEIRIAKEAEYMDKLLENISKNEKAAYGIKEVNKAYEYGAIEVLLISDEFLRKEREKWDVDSFIKDVEDMNGEVIIMSTEFEPGKRLDALGGAAALLRFDFY
ncbi:MAG: mRNA surveillance protein pelota [Archaeoglobaceae archaeon]